MKQLTVEQVKRLPVGAVVRWVQESTGRHANLTVVKSGRKKMLRGAFSLYGIENKRGWHYEVV